MCGAKKRASAQNKVEQRRYLAERKIHIAATNIAGVEPEAKGVRLRTVATCTTSFCAALVRGDAGPAESSRRGPITAARAT